MILQSLFVFFLTSSFLVFSDANYNIYSSRKEDDNPFMSLLHNIVKINENRVNNLKKSMQLQDFIARKGRLLTEDEEERVDSVEDEEPGISGYKYEPLTYPSMKYNSSEDDSRRTWMGPCVKKAAKACRTACTNSAKEVCSAYRCSSRVKRMFRNECRKNCNSEFKTSRYYSDYSEYNVV